MLKKDSLLFIKANVKNIVYLIDFDLLNTMVQLVFLEIVGNIVIFQVKILTFHHFRDARFLSRNQNFSIQVRYFM